MSMISAYFLGFYVIYSLIDIFVNNVYFNNDL
jgi:surface polysaccharide O-acyltransferase-like enzyme